MSYPKVSFKGNPLISITIMKWKDLQTSSLDLKESLRLVVNLKEALPMLRIINQKVKTSNQRNLVIKTTMSYPKVNLKGNLLTNTTIMKWKCPPINNSDQKENLR